MPSGNRQLLTMTFWSEPSGFITWIRLPLSSSTNRRPAALLRPDVGFDFVARDAVMLFSFHIRCPDLVLCAGGLCRNGSTDSALLTNPKALAQEPLQDLAATALRQL